MSTNDGLDSPGKRLCRSGLSALILLPVLCLAVIGAVTVLQWCSEVPPVVSPEGLLLPACAFPEQWSDRPIDTSKTAAAIFASSAYDAAMKEYQLNQNNDDKSSWAVHSVARYQIEEKAHRNYLQLRSSYLDDAPLWPEMSKRGQIGLHADEYRLIFVLETQTEGDVGRCLFTARYGRYVSEFVLMARPGDIEADHVQSLVVAIDGIFAKLPDR